MVIGNNTLTIRTFLCSLRLLRLHTHTRRIFASSFSTGPLGDRGALHCHRNAIAAQLGKFYFRRAAFYQSLKSKNGLAAAKTAALQINLNIDGATAVA
jgi:hypothetical protein